MNGVCVGITDVIMTGLTLNFKARDGRPDDRVSDGNIHQDLCGVNEASIAPCK